MFGKDKKEDFHEKILYEAQPNIFVYSKGILISMFVLGFLFFLYSAGIQYIGNMNVYLIGSTKVPMTRYFAIAVFILIMIVLLYIILKLLIWTSIKYTITESRVIVEKGILLQKKNYMPFNTIQDVSRSQSLLGKIFSVGTITLYSAYDGKDLELKDVSSPKKIEDIIFENIRGTHLRYQNGYDDFNSNFNPIRPNQEPGHYMRMEDLDDLELVDAKERKRQLREIRRQAKQSRNNPNYNSNYNTPYGSNDHYYDDYNSPNDFGGYGYDDYSRDRNYRESRAPRENYNNQYDSRRKPDSHHHQYSGAIKDSYSRNPDKYFANNYEEFHQNNLDAQRDYDDRIQGGNPYGDYNEEPSKVEKKSKGLSRFNPFSSSNDEKDDYYEDISDAEFDTTINQAMHDMGDNLKFKPSNDNRFRDDYNPVSGSREYDRRYDRAYDKGPGRSYDMNYDGYDDRYYDDYSDRHNANSHRYPESMPLRDGHNNPNHYDNRHESFNQRDYRQNENYRHSNSRNQNYRSNSHYDANHTRPYSGDGEIDYKYMSPRESRKKSGRNSGSHYDDYNQYMDESDAESGNDKKNKTSDDLFEKHSRKFRR
ncbi:MAG: PH domain-containing protein [Methanobrevibacter ruminantium]|uniref:PH domain-containing protein n=1 Tax=Methanobrevibacter ruminantium TaxID=83816 RepID=UPI0026E938EC|nr:PH domain-containing protein [Methanobrevibacter ruminantium]MDO5841878.1 PH domain-containing protein [Methanobrevibacter ruminantium]